MSVTEAGPQWDAVVIGAGPAGSACAWHLAHRGRRVLLLERNIFPRDKSCGDGLTPHSIGLLDEMGILERFADARRIAGVRIVHRGPPVRHRYFPYGELAGPHNYGLIVPRLLLDAAIAEAAVAVGATLSVGTRALALHVEEGRAVGVIIEQTKGGRQVVRAPIIVVADGAASHFSGWGQRGPRDASALGTAIRGYFGGLSDLGPFQEVFLPLTDQTGNYILPSYGWIFPTGPGTANVGIGLFSKVPFDNARDLYRRFIDDLKARDPRFNRAQPLGVPLAAPLRFDFSPERCAAPGILRVGDAAGLTSPFTGEGISYGLESGRIAAETIDRCLALSPNSPPFEDDYRTVLGRRFAGYFETGRHAAQRHRLVWQVLDASFDSERPVFGLLRRTLLVPEGAGRTADFSDDLASVIPNVDPLLPRQMLEASALLIEGVRLDWTFVARLEQANLLSGMMLFRPSLLLLLAARFGDAARPGLTRLAAALDLAYLGIVAQSGIEEKGLTSEHASGNWSNKFAILLSDYLMVRALEMTTPVDGHLSDRIIPAFERSCRGQLAQLRAAWQADLPLEDAINHLADKASPLFELPCVLGAVAAGGGPTAAEAMRAYGRNLALAYTLTEELQALDYNEFQPISAMASDLSRGILSIPVLCIWRRPELRQEMQALLNHRPVDRRALASLASGGKGDEIVISMARGYAESAYRALAPLPLSTARSALERIAAYTVERIESVKPAFVRSNRRGETVPHPLNAMPLGSIHSPEDLRRIEVGVLRQVADQLRAEIVDAVEASGGSLGQGLDAVELTIALNYIFDTPRDRLVWEIGDQVYPQSSPGWTQYQD